MRSLTGRLLDCFHGAPHHCARIHRPWICPPQGHPMTTRLGFKEDPEASGRLRQASKTPREPSGNREGFWEAPGSFRQAPALGSSGKAHKEPHKKPLLRPSGRNGRFINRKRLNGQISRFVLRMADFILPRVRSLSAAKPSHLYRARKANGRFIKAG